MLATLDSRTSEHNCCSTNAIEQYCVQQYFVNPHPPRAYWAFNYHFYPQADYHVAAIAEIDEIPRQVLNHHHPDVPIRVWDVHNMPVVECYVDLAAITFPCTEVSAAGLRTGRSQTGELTKVTQLLVE